MSNTSNSSSGEIGLAVTADRAVNAWQGIFTDDAEHSARASRDSLRLKGL